MANGRKSEGVIWKLPGPLHSDLETHPGGMAGRGARAASCRSGTWALEPEDLGANRGSPTSYRVNWGSYFPFCAVRDPSVKQG